jgi:hypothetical protein
MWTRRNPLAFSTAVAVGGVPFLFVLIGGLIQGDGSLLTAVPGAVTWVLPPVLTCGTIARFGPWRLRWWAYLGLIVLVGVGAFLVVLVAFLSWIFAHFGGV